jgi:hypothetical protein
VLDQLLVPLAPRVDKNLGNPRGEKGCSGSFTCGSKFVTNFNHQQCFLPDHFMMFATSWWCELCGDE